MLSQQEEVRVLRQENEQMRQQLTALATELASLRERIGRKSRLRRRTSLAHGSVSTANQRSVVVHPR